MKAIWMGGTLAMLAFVWAGGTGRAGRAQSTQAPPAAAQAAPKATSNQEINDAFVQKFTKQIAGHEQDPASQVFKNVQLDIFKKTPASRFLLIMDQGYSAALGVSCKHCHVEDDFSKDDKRPKLCAREMAVMHFGINQQLAKMQNLEPNPNGHFINCSTCHRGAIDPLAQK